MRNIPIEYQETVIRYEPLSDFATITCSIPSEHDKWLRLGNQMLRRGFQGVIRDDRDGIEIMIPKSLVRIIMGNASADASKA